MSKSLDDFDLDNPKLPKAIEERALTSGTYPYEKRLDKDLYAETLERLQIELVKLQADSLEKGTRMVLLFEGRDAAGKGGTIRAMTERVSPRTFRLVALPAPSDREKSQMYVQRYLAHFPAAGEIVIYDRSWYNRAGVEHVMGFCTKKQYRDFL